MEPRLVVPLSASSDAIISASNVSSTANQLTLVPISVRVTAAVGFLLVAIFGALGNGLSMFVLRKLGGQRWPHLVFIGALCCADLLFCVTSVPWEIPRLIVGRWSYSSRALCCTIGFIKYTNFGLSLLLISLVAVNRLILIVFPNVYDCVYSTFSVVTQIAGTLIFSLLLHLPILVGVWGSFGLEPRTQRCGIVAISHVSPAKILFVFAFILPSCTILLCYSSIIVHVVRTSRRVKLCGSQAAIASRRNRIRQRELGVVRTSAVVFIVFVLLCLPNTLFKMGRLGRSPVVAMFCTLLMHSTACVNPFIYVFMDKQYRSACFQLITCGGRVAEPRDRSSPTVRAVSDGSTTH